MLPNLAGSRYRGALILGCEKTDAG